MKKLNTMEMRSVDGGARYATCYVCGKRKKLKWTWSVIVWGWNGYIRRENDLAGYRHQSTGRCW